jgi:pimeloyl-ACP methyl ester carboxylesterase
MTKRRRPWLLGITLFLCAAVAAAGAGIVLGSRGQPPATAQPGGTAAPAAPAPGATQARADLATMQSLLNSGSIARQAALLAPPLKFASGSGPVVPPGTTITIQPGTLHASGQHATVRAHLSGGTAVTLYLAAVKGHWRLYDATTGAQTSARVTGQSGTARLMAATVWVNYMPTEDQIKQKWPVIFIHGIGGQGSDWGAVGDDHQTPTDSNSMLYKVNQVTGTYVLSFNYDTGGPDSANTKWVDNAASGPAFAKYVNQVAAVSKKAGGPGKVIVVAFSMGGLVTRYAAAYGAAGSIAMVTTIGTPNLGTPAANFRQFICYNLITRPFVPDQYQNICGWSGADALTAFNHQISALPMLPSSISTVHAIAGNEFFVKSILGAHVGAWWGGDGIVPLYSALAKRPGGSHDTFKSVMNPLIPGNISAWHLNLQTNSQVIQLVTGYVADWIRENPVQPIPAAPAALGGDAYWLADGGTWNVHGLQLQISRGPSGLTGTQTWNAGGNIEIGHAQLAFTSNADGSLTGTYTADGTHTYAKTPPAGFIPEPDSALPQQGQTIRLVPVSPHLAKSVYNGNSPSLFVGGNTNLCQADLPNASQYCGA